MTYPLQPRRDPLGIRDAFQFPASAGAEMESAKLVAATDDVSPSRP
jgi:hypothetical protein